MSEAEPIPPTSSVTALRIPMIKKGEYDLWSMKMRQYIAITDHILWDIITNGDQATTDPASSSAPKTSLAANARRNNEKALNILLSAIPDRHLLSFHDATDAKTLWSAIKARFGGNEASKKMQKNLLKQQFETFTIGSREELDSAYERFQNILSMLELYDAKVSQEDANLKFLRSLPSVWHVVATMIRGQPGLDELEFDDLYNNLKVYEHELKGVSNSSSQNIAFLSTEVKGSTLKQSTADPANIPKGYTQAASSKVQTAPNCASHSDEIICSFFAQQASMPTTHDDEDLLQIDEDAMEEIDIRWQVAMITARIRKFMRKTGRPIDLKPKNGITFDKSKIECFNCQKLGHFARECRFAKYQENRANGRNEKRIVAIEDSNSKALVATDNNEDIDWTKEFDAEPVTFAMMALTEVEQDDWSMEFDAEHVHFGQDGLGDFDWSNKADDTPVSLALMATNSEVPYCSKCSKSYKKLLESYQTERDNFQKARSEILGYQMSLESLEVILKTHEKNEYAWGDKNKVVNQEKTKTSQPEIDRNKVIIEDWVDSDDEETDSSKIQKKTVFNSEIVKTSFENKVTKTVNTVLVQESRTKGIGNKGGQSRRDLKDLLLLIDSGVCSGSMTGDKDKLSDFKEFKGGYVAFGNDSKGGRISGKGTIKTSCIDFEKVSYVEELKFNLLSVSQICDKKHNVLFTDKECLILSPKFKFVDEDLVILRAPRKNDVYSLDLKNIIPSGGITCLVAKATKDEAVLWHRRLGHVNFKNINKLVKGNLKGVKQHRAFCKKIEKETIREPLELLHMDLFGPVSVESVNRKKYCLVVTDDCSKFSWVFFLAYKDETYDMLHDLIVGLIKIQAKTKVKTIRKETVSTHVLLMNLDVQCSLFMVPNNHAAQICIQRELSLAKLHNDASKDYAFEKEMKEISTWKRRRKRSERWCFLYKLFDAEYTEHEEGGEEWTTNNMDPNQLMSPLLLHFRFHKTSSLKSDYRQKGNPRKSSQALADEKWLKRARRTASIQATENMARLVALRVTDKRKVWDFVESVSHQLLELKAIRLFLAFASFMFFTVYLDGCQKCILYYGNLQKKLYVNINLRRGAIDKTLFIKKDRRDIMLVQVYVDDIIFGSTKSSMVKDFEDLIKRNSR
ncbi:ribonuclease H-like domain-containing protein [Tanacetum coccineum]